MTVTVSELLITSSVLIAAVLLLRKCLRGKVSARLLYLLWAVVAIRLLFPFSFPADTSVMNLPAAQQVDHFITQRVIRIAPDNTPASPAQTETPATPEGSQPAVSPLLGVWAGGAALTGGWLLYVNLRFYRRLRRCRIPVAADSPLPVYQVDIVSSPCLFGLIRPAVYVPAHAVQDPTVFRHVLIHELCHWRQRDHIWSLVRAVCLALYWFHPLVWAAAFFSREDCELSCDELAIRTLGEDQRIPYGHTLVGMVRAHRDLREWGCMATTMTSGGRGLRKRIFMIAAAPKHAIPAFLILVLALGVLVSCTFTQLSGITPQQAIDQLEASISYRDGIVSFTLPEEYADGSDWNIQVYGRMQMGDGYMSVHLFEAENAEKSWKPGEIYSIYLTPDQYDSLNLDASLYSDPEAACTIDLLAAAGGGPVEGTVPVQDYNVVYVTFPAYQDGRTEYNAKIYDTAPFDVQLLLPRDWEVRLPDAETGRGSPVSGALWTPVDVYDGETHIASIGFNRYTPYEGDDLPEGDEYKTVYPELRLPRMEIWDPYTPVRTDEDGESGIASITYVDPDFLEANPNASMAAAPELQTKGVLCFHRGLTAYVGIRFDGEASVRDDTLTTIAESLLLLPGAEPMYTDWDFGPTGKRYPGNFSTLHDYSGIQVLDADGTDITGILVDLWYCASEAYNVDDAIFFTLGESARLSENYPEFYELTNYAEKIQSVFTPNAIAQYEASDVTAIQKTEDGRVWRLGPWRTGYSYGFALTGLEAVDTSLDRMTIRATYETNEGGIMREEDPDYVPNYRTVDFTVVKADGVWYVDDYTYPESV